MKKKVLIVDDNIAFCENVADILEMKGYETVSIHDGAKALEVVKEDGFDLVLMDIKMPVMNGVETFKKIKKVAPQIPVIMMSAYAVEDLIREVLREGAFGILQKPLDIEYLFSIMEDTPPDGALILVVDDNPELKANLVDVLGEKGYRVKTAEDGPGAVRKATESKFDIILLDMNLPILNGLETYMHIRNIRPDVVVIIITGYLKEQGDLAQQTLDGGAYVCLEKPLDMDRLLNLLQEITLKSGGTLGKADTPKEDQKED